MTSEHIEYLTNPTTGRVTARMVDDVLGYRREYPYIYRKDLRRYVIASDSYTLHGIKTLQGKGLIKWC